MTTSIHILINLIEAFLFPFFIANYFDFQNKRKYIIIVALFHFIMLNFCTFFYKSNLLLTSSIITSVLISIYYIKHTLCFNHIFITIFYNFLILASALSVLVINNALSFIFHFFFTYDIDFFVASCFISRFILAIVTLLLLHNKINLSLSFNLRYWNFIILFEFLLLCSIGIITRSLIINDFNRNIFILLLVIMIVISLLFIIMLIHINDANKIKIDSEKKKQKESFEIQKINMIKNIKYEMDNTNHKMFYILYNIEKSLRNQEYDSAISLLELYRLQISKYKLLVDTGNSIFDYMFSLKINKLIIDGIDINTCIIISKNPFYDNIKYINLLTDLVTLLSKSNKIVINISEITNFSIIKLFFDSNQINDDKIKNLLSIFSNSFKVKYTINSQQIKISIKMEDFYDF